MQGALASTGVAYERAKEIVSVLSTRSDDLVRALMGVFAAFLFKTLVFPMMVLLALWKTVGSFNFNFNRKDGVL